MSARQEYVSLSEAKRLVSAKVRDPQMPADLFIKGILFLERHSTWKRRTRMPRQEPDINDMVRKIEAAEKKTKGVQ